MKIYYNKSGLKLVFRTLLQHYTCYSWFLVLCYSIIMIFYKNIFNKFRCLFRHTNFFYIFYFTLAFTNALKL